jgi:hypothetical protein
MINFNSDTNITFSVIMNMNLSKEERLSLILLGIVKVICLQILISVPFIRSQIPITNCLVANSSLRVFRKP